MKSNVKSDYLSESGFQVPIIHCRGSHYDVGHQVGFKFREMTQDLLTNWKYFKEILQAGTTLQGQKLIQQSLALCLRKYPEYVEEIRGMAKGAEIEFEKLFMLNIDSILETLIEENVEVNKIGGTGCTSILCNKEEVILGHTEDALAEIKDHIYIVSAEIIETDDAGKENILEKFTTLCCAGTLVGYTMGFNSHGMIYSVNTLFPSVYTIGTPRSFIARALLGCSDLPSVINVLKDKGSGISDGFSLNVFFYPRNDSEDTKPVLCNIEVAPPQNDCGTESIVDVFEVEAGTCYMHCNRYLRVAANELKEDAIVYSDKRISVICQRGNPKCEQDIKEILSDQTDHNYPIYNDGGKDHNREYVMNFIRTVAVGIFNVNQKTWKVYTSPPATGNPIHTFNLQ